VPSHAEQEQIEQLATECLRKRKAGQKPSAREESALRKFQAQREEAQRWQYYGSIPKKHYVQMSGRQHKILDDQASRYGIPIRGESIDLARVLTWLHDFLAENGPLLLRSVGTEQLLSGDVQDSPALEKLREETYKLKRLERLEKERNLLRRDQIHEGFSLISGVLRAAGDQLQKKFGPDALEVLNRAMEQAEQEIVRVLGDVQAGDLYGEEALTPQAEQ
jgi:hypothetical protein